MAGLVDACSSADDHAYPDHWSGLATVYSGLQHQSFFLPLIIFWITLGILFLILLRWVPQARWHGGLQVAGDVVMISLLVYSTGLQESYFILLYLLVIIVASILFSRRIAFLVTATCFLLLAAMTVLAYAEKIPRTFSALPTTESLRTWLVMNLLGFLAVAYLASLLAQSLRKKGVELEEKREELLSLQDFTEDIIHSMRGGLITTDLDGRMLLLNRTGEEILGHRFADLRGKKLQELNEDFWLPVNTKIARGSPLGKKLTSARPPGTSAIWASVFRRCVRATRNATATFQFQDLTDLRRLEQEVATKERMAALGRLSAAIAHEIRQPLTAMAGAVKELAAPRTARRRRKASRQYCQQGIRAAQQYHHGLSQLFSREDLRISACRCSRPPR